MDRQAEIREEFERQTVEKLQRGAKMSSRFFALQSKLTQLSKLGRFEEASEIKLQLQDEQEKCLRKREAEVEQQLMKKMETLIQAQEKEYKSL